MTQVAEALIPIFVVIADYQVLTDRDRADDIAENVNQLVLDYIAAGLDPENSRTYIFPHSCVPELNQLLVPFLTLVTNSERLMDNLLVKMTERMSAPNLVKQRVWQLDSNLVQMMDIQRVLWRAIFVDSIK